MSLGAFTGDFLYSVEKRVKVKNEYGYMKMFSGENIWYPKVVRDNPIEGKTERLIWLLSTASIEQLTAADGGEDGGSVNYDELATIMQEYAPAYFARGYKIGKLKWLNFLQAGLDPVGKWAQDIGAYGAYIPQRLAAIALLNGGNVNGYDGVPFFSASHPNHPLIAALGFFANDFTGAPVAASGLTPAYPGALPVDDSVALDTAMTNYSKALAYISGAIGQPNGAGDPRMLEPLFALHPPRMQVRMHQLHNADTIAQLAGSSGAAAGGADVREVWKKYRLAEPVEAKELDGGRSYTFPNPATGGTSTVTGDDKTYYIVCREATETDVGGLLQIRRLPFTLHTYSGETGTQGIDAVLGRAQQVEYLYDGATSVQYGHPYTIFKFRGS